MTNPEPRGRRLALLLILAAVRLTAVPIPDFLGDLNLIFNWEPTMKMGSLSRGDDRLVFHTETPVAIFNSDKKLFLGAVYYGNDGLSFSGEAEQRIKELFPEPEGADAPRFSKIFIDPGHGGIDPGTSTDYDINGEKLVLVEKDIVLNLGMLLYNQLRQAYPDRKIILSRNDDTTLQLENRSEMANAQLENMGSNEHMLFISLHANWSFNRLARGFEVWYLPPESKRKNLKQESSGDSGLDTMLTLIMTEELNKESEDLAHFIMEGLDDSVGDQTLNRGMKQEEWSVVQRTNMASTLVEIGFISNLGEARQLLSRDYLQKLADGIYNGIQSFLRYYEDS